ncbi:phosphotransferase [Candidatus Leptofilum sp.]|uniref:phosphotransferase n=1 Tax=Candidatus Leptofilum sp. TaxID=3241576 RepID=UPI003B5C0847
MLEKPTVADEAIVACVQDAFGLKVREISFLPLGADMNTAVYRLITPAQEPYFLKLRSGLFKETSVTLPRFLLEQGVSELISPCLTKSGTLWVALADYKVMLYPFINGHDAYDVPLTDALWRQFGRALKKVHTAVLPQSLAKSIPRETYSPKWRQMVTKFMQQIQEQLFEEPVARKMATFLTEQQASVARLVAHTEQLAQIVQKRPQQNVLCHSDIHAWNLLISESGVLYIVDWDDPILAPKERGLMFVGAGLGNIWHTPREEALFYEGYGSTKIMYELLEYYRCERIIQDIAVYCEQIFLSVEGGDVRETSYRNLASNFLPNRTIDIAINSRRHIS